MFLHLGFHRLSKEIAEALEGIEIDVSGDITQYSRNFKMDASMPQDTIQTSMQGNLIFDPSSQLPREVMLETTLKAFGQKLDIWEVCAYSFFFYN